jgi:hypothetical protein
LYVNPEVKYPKLFTANCCFGVLGCLGGFCGFGGGVDKPCFILSSNSA